jgi:hypothetical protein
MSEDSVSYHRLSALRSLSKQSIPGKGERGGKPFIAVFRIAIYFNYFHLLPEPFFSAVSETVGWTDGAQRLAKLSCSGSSTTTQCSENVKQAPLLPKANKRQGQK